MGKADFYDFTIYIRPRPWTSYFPIPGGKTLPNGRKVFGFSPKGYKQWKEAVYLLIKQAYQGPVFDTPIFLNTYFYLHKKVSGVFPRKIKPDVTNLRKALEDAAQGVLFTNDALVVGGTMHKFNVGNVFGTHANNPDHIRIHIGPYIFKDQQEGFYQSQVDYINKGGKL